MYYEHIRGGHRGTPWLSRGEEECLCQQFDLENDDSDKLFLFRDKKRKERRAKRDKRRKKRENREGVSVKKELSPQEDLYNAMVLLEYINENPGKVFFV